MGFGINVEDHAFGIEKCEFERSTAHGRMYGVGSADPIEWRQSREDLRIAGRYRLGGQRLSANVADESQNKKRSSQ